MHVCGAFGSLVAGIVSDATGSTVSAMYGVPVPFLLGGLMTIAAPLTFDRDRSRVPAG